MMTKFTSVKNTSSRARDDVGAAYLNETKSALSMILEAFEKSIAALGIDFNHKAGQNVLIT